MTTPTLDTHTTTNTWDDALGTLIRLTADDPTAARNAIAYFRGFTGGYLKHNPVIAQGLADGLNRGLALALNED